MNRCPREPYEEGRKVPRLGGDGETLSDGQRAPDGLIGHQPRPQLARRSHLSTGPLRNDAVATVSAASLPGLGVKVGLRVGEGVSNFARH